MQDALLGSGLTMATFWHGLVSATPISSTQSVRREPDKHTDTTRYKISYSPSESLFCTYYAPFLANPVSANFSVERVPSASQIT